MGENGWIWGDGEMGMDEWNKERKKGKEKKKNACLHNPSLSEAYMRWRAMNRRRFYQ